MKKVEGKKVWVFLPAYNARETLKKTYQNIPRDLVHEILLVDDASQDGTPELARSLSIRTVVHERKKRSQGGSLTDPDNLMACCPFCNGFVEDRPEVSRSLGLVVYSYENPSQMPVKRIGP